MKTIDTPLGTIGLVDLCNRLEAENDQLREEIKTMISLMKKVFDLFGSEKRYFGVREAKQ